MKRLILCLAVMGLIFSMVAGGSSAEAWGVKKQSWKLSHVRPQGSPVDKDVCWFADKLREATDGRIDIKIYGSSQLGDYMTVHERISVGAVEMACQPPSAAADKRVQILNLPYMVRNWGEAKKNYVSGTPLMKTAADLFAKQNIKLLAVYPVYFGGVALKEKPEAPGDPNIPKNMKLRVIPLRSFQLLAENLGYQATPIPFSEAFTALQTGIVDGLVGSGAEGYYNNFRDVISYYIPANTHFEQWYLYMNMDLWNKLSDEDQKILVDVAKEFEDRRVASAEEEQAANEKRLSDYGIKVIPITDGQINDMAQKYRANAWPKLKKDLGEKWFDKVISELQYQ